MENTVFLYNNLEFSISQDEHNVIIGFFEKKGYSTEVAITLASLIIKQANDENISPMSVMETFKGVDLTTINKITALIMNNMSGKTSMVGYINRDMLYEDRNIIF